MDPCEEYSEREVARRLEAALRGSREVGHKPMASMTPKRLKAQRKSRKASSHAPLAGVRSIKSPRPISSDLNNVVVASGMTFAKHQREKLSLVGRIRGLLGSRPEPPRSVVEQPGARSLTAENRIPGAKPGFGKRGASGRSADRPSETTAR